MLSEPLGWECEDFRWEVCGRDEGGTPPAAAGGGLPIDC